MTADGWYMTERKVMPREPDDRRCQKCGVLSIGDCPDPPTCWVGAHDQAASMPTKGTSGPSQEGTVGSDAAPAATAQGAEDIVAMLRNVNIANKPTDALCWDAAAELSRLRADLAAARADMRALRELLNCYNLGGWTDAERLMKERDAARSALAAAEGDARRYRQLRQGGGNAFAVISADRAMYLHGDELDRTLDAAAGPGAT